MTMMKRSLALLISAFVCLAAAPASATRQGGKDRSDDRSVLLHGKSRGNVSLGALPFGAIRLDLGRHDNGLHLGQLKKKKLHAHQGNGLYGSGPKGGVITRPPAQDVPMPEPSAALLFGLGTGIVGLRLRRRR